MNVSQHYSKKSAKGKWWSLIFWLKSAVLMWSAAFLLQMCGWIFISRSSSVSAWVPFWSSFQMRTFITLRVYERQQQKNTLMVSLHLAATLSLLFTRLVLIYNSQGQANTAVAPLHLDMNMLWALPRPQCGQAVYTEYLPENIYCI